MFRRWQSLFLSGHVYSIPGRCSLYTPIATFPFVLWCRIVAALIGFSGGHPFIGSFNYRTDLRRKIRFQYWGRISQHESHRANRCHGSFRLAALFIPGSQPRNRHNIDVAIVGGLCRLRCITGLIHYGKLY